MTDPQLPNVDWKVVLNRAAPPGIRGWGRVRASQIDETCRGFTVAAWGQTLNAVLLTFILRHSVPSWQLALWLLALVGLMLVGLDARRRWKRLKAVTVSRKAIERVAWLSILFGVIWMMPAYTFFSHATPGEQLAICMITASMMAGATFVFPTLPHAALGYVLIMGPVATHILGSTGSLLIAAIGPIYTAALVGIAISNGKAFMERRCTELALEERSETISLLLKEYESSDADWLWETNWALELQNVSPRFARAIGREIDQIEGKPIRHVLGGANGLPAELAKALEGFGAALEKHAPLTDLLVPVSVQGGVKSIQLSARPRFTSSGRFIGYRGVGSDVTEAQQAQHRIAHMARHDALTGLPNRLQLLEALGGALDEARETNTRCAVLLIDLDRFKTVNDTLGHVAGDHLLQQVSTRFDPLTTPDMTAGRLGGDEFAIVIPNAEPASIEATCRDVIKSIKRPFVYHDQHLFVGASIGIAFGPGDGETVEELIRNADLALYRAKADGGNDICFYEPSLHAQAEERRQIELAMRGALEAGEFRLVYQPVIDLETSRIKSFEALLRWTSPEMGEVPPWKFIPLAEETGLIRRIGEWVLRTALVEAATWPKDVSIAVNISPLQLNDPSFTMMLVSALSQSGLDPRRLELEITETVFLQLTPLTQKVLQQIQSLDVRLAIDDFGTGYSSLGYLRDSHFDTIKIDRSFVSGLSEEEPDSSAIVRAVVALAGSLGMTTIAEGVETEEQMAIVTALGCDKVQGYLVSRPRPGSEVRAMLADQARRAA